MVDGARSGVSGYFKFGDDVACFGQLCRLVEDDHGVRIEGEGSERARVAYASEVNGKLVYTVGKGVQG